MLDPSCQTHAWLIRCKDLLAFAHGQHHPLPHLQPGAQGQQVREQVVLRYALLPQSQTREMRYLDPLNA